MADNSPKPDASTQLTKDRVLQVRQSQTIDEIKRGQVFKTIEIEAAYLRNTSNVIATGEGILFKNWRPLNYSSDPKKSLSRKIFGARWSYVRDAYRRALKSCFNRTDFNEGLWISNKFSANYYHWFCEELPKLILLEPHEVKHNLILPENIYALPYVRASLDILGYTNVTTVPEKQSLKVKSLYTIDSASPSNFHLPEVVENINAIFQTRAPTTQTPSPERIYISRKLANKRRIENEDELEATLKKYGFKIVAMEDLGFLEQSELMRDCKILVSMHGAGLTNMVFMKREGKILEIRSEGNPPCFVNLADAMKHQHYSTPCEKTQPELSSNWSNVKVDIEQFNRTIKALIDNQ